MSILQPQPLPRGSFHDTLHSLSRAPLLSRTIVTLQVNMGYRCNLTCTHCHIEAGPGRRETMDGNTVDAVIAVLASSPIAVIDITGGAPELNLHFRRLVAGAHRFNKHVIVRTNLTVLNERGMGDLPMFFRDCNVEIIASLPCYQEKNVDGMRGSGVFARCIASLTLLNRLGYGMPGGLPLRLVYNPAGPFLPPHQDRLEQDYRRELGARYGISFTSLYALANMPIGRFRERLARSGELDRYRELLSDSFNPATLEGIMCRDQISVGWDGRLYDCDFNQVLGLTVDPSVPGHIGAFDHETLARRTVRVGDHCYGCTAGSGSTCAGAAS